MNDRVGAFLYLPARVNPAQQYLWLLFLLPVATRWHLDTVFGLGELPAVPREPALGLTPGQQQPKGPKALPTAL